MNRTEGIRRHRPGGATSGTSHSPPQIPRTTARTSTAVDRIGIFVTVFYMKSDYSAFANYKIASDSSGIFKDMCVMRLAINLNEQRDEALKDAEIFVGASTYNMIHPGVDGNNISQTYQFLCAMAGVPCSSNLESVPSSIGQT